jgi:hypothetical protein
LSGRKFLTSTPCYNHVTTEDAFLALYNQYGQWGQLEQTTKGQIKTGTWLKSPFSLAFSNCGGALKIIAAIEDPPVIDKILSHLGLPTRAPPRAPARRVDLFQTI